MLLCQWFIMADRTGHGAYIRSVDWCAQEAKHALCLLRMIPFYEDCQIISGHDSIFWTVAIKPLHCLAPEMELRLVFDE
ncbi:hypothetical protein AtDm6_3126 [Acetobacter tropicalis]|uniref:Uncharacterized protein n=1 Tax=Acetobacter tropicalis TaxID=104102 RepID=A0A094ZET4_9PROT|nr:hypothetical protein AtDm6_3126 [Acetobacter tropicalis]